MARQLKMVVGFVAGLVIAADGSLAQQASPTRKPSPVEAAQQVANSTSRAVIGGARVRAGNRAGSSDLPRDPRWSPT